ncbi:MAG: Hsp20/alpha crystallin family protein [Spirochaetaceae bacterium]|nr:Hsp20/alpha crystallin family protein [Spirochaetaceae bacterium]
MKSLTMNHPMESVRTLVDIDRIINSFFANPYPEAALNSNGRYPMVDIRETNDSYIFEAALPGFCEKDVEVILNGSTLTISSKHENLNKVEKPKDGEGGTYIIRERNYESFSRSFKLPENADSSSVAADFTNGLLTLNVKKRAESQKRVIEINAVK